MRCIAVLLLSLGLLVAARADGPGDNQPDKVRRVPPPGVKVPDTDRLALEESLARLRSKIDELVKSATPEQRELLPDVEIYYKAVHDALKYDEFFNVKDIAKEVAVAKNLIEKGLERAQALADGKHPWTTQTGSVVRAYKSKIDGSIQPYGMVIPKNYDFKKPIRLDFWCHGRGETLSELNFVQQRQSSPGEFSSEKAIVLHLYGRYCCANKLAGEVDCFEALAHARKHYAIDENRLVMRGFSMGGAACWQFAVHYPSLWCAAAPGAGFSETRNFLEVFQKEDVSQAPWWEKKLWHMYDCTDYALNLYNLPTVAYSGEIDKQKQAADMMAKAMKKEGLELVHIIGPKTAHAYEKNAKAELIEKIDAIADKGRNPLPEQVKFVTYTLRYHDCFWIKVRGLGQHWERAQVEAKLTGKEGVSLTTKNVTDLLIQMPEGLSPFEAGSKPKIEIDGQVIESTAFVTPKLSFYVELQRVNDKWSVATKKETPGELRKRPGLQGPIDDAFLDSFLMVRPTGKPDNANTSQWVDAEMKHAMTHWRRQFRGEAPVKDDKDVTENDINNSNLILWGDPDSNAVLKKLAGKLPIKWKDGKVTVGEESFDAGTHVPVLIYPNPLNPKKYIVLNSGFTFREYDYLNNARQVPKLPDYAIVDVTTPPSARYPGKIVTAGFFDEKWQLTIKK